MTPTPTNHGSSQPAALVQVSPDAPTLDVAEGAADDAEPDADASPVLGGKTAARRAPRSRRWQTCRCSARRSRRRTAAPGRACARPHPAAPARRAARARRRAAQRTSSGGRASAGLRPCEQAEKEGPRSVRAHVHRVRRPAGADEHDLRARWDGEVERGPAVVADIPRHARRREAHGRGGQKISASHADIRVRGRDEAGRVGQKERARVIQARDGRCAAPRVRPPLAGGRGGVVQRGGEARVRCERAAEGIGARHVGIAGGACHTLSQSTNASCSLFIFCRGASVRARTRDRPSSMFAKLLVFCAGRREKRGKSDVEGSGKGAKR
jgi:hypothetical protein